MTTIRKINVSQVEGDGANNNNTSEIRPYGEMAVYVGDNDKLELLMFDGVRTHLRSKVLSKGTFYGGDADSADGIGLDTIKLVPDEVLRRTGSDQYLVIDPTGPDHIHIRAGGTINDSNAVLILGGEQNNVSVRDADGVTITAEDTLGSKTWMFDQAGHITFPDYTVQTTAYTGSSNSNIWVQDFETSLGSPIDVPAAAVSVEYLANGDIVALFAHYTDSNDRYNSIARFNSTGTKMWSMAFQGAQFTDGWGLAVDNVNGFIYVVSRADNNTADNDVATLTKLSQTDGNVVWSKAYDVGYNNTNAVVDIASDGSPIVVGFANNGNDNQVVTTKITADTGAVTWSRALNGQNGEEAYGMAVGPNNEVVAVGSMSQFDEVTSYSVTPQYGSGTGILVINRSDLNGATFTDSWEVAGTGITGTANVNYINSYDALTGTVQQGSGAEFTIEVNGAVINTESVMGNIVVGTETFGGNTAYGYSSITSPTFGSTTATSLAELYYVNEAPTPYTRLQLIPGDYEGFTVSVRGLINDNTETRLFNVVQGGAEMTPEEVSPGVYVYFNRSGDVFNLALENTQTLSVKVGYSDIPDTPGTYSVLVTNGGTNYLTGHKVKVLGSALGGTTPENDVVITVDAVVSGAITSVSRTGDANVAAVGPYTAVAHTNHLTGSGLEFTIYLDGNSTYTEHPVDITAVGTNYATGDVVVIPGTQLGGTSPANDLTVTVSANNGAVLAFGSFSGTQQTTTYRIIVAEALVDFSGPGTWTLSGTTVDSDDRMLVVKYNSTGAIQWQKAIQVEAGFNCFGADADIDSEGNIYVCGNYVYDGADPSNDDNAMIIIKFNSSGVKQWTRKVIGDCQDYASSIVVGPDDCLYLNGITSTNNNNDYSMVIAKYNLDGTVAWQRLLDNTTTWTFVGSFFIGEGGGSNLAVKNGYVAVAGTYGDPGGTEPHAILAQFDSDGTVWAAGNYDFITATFSGQLDSSASNITVVDAAKTDSDYSNAFTITDFDPDFDLTSDLIGTLYTQGNVSSSINNGIYSVGVDANGVVTMTTSRGTVEFGALPEPGGTTHFHIMKGAGQNGNDGMDLYFGDDFNYVLQRPAASNGAPGYGVEIGANDNDGGAQHVWRFGTDGRLSKVEDLTLTTSGQFNICTIQTAGSGYTSTDPIPTTTTGGTGTGMTVNFGYGLSGQLTSVSVSNPGTGYTNGDVISVVGGTGTFVITRYNELANQANNNTVESDWAFGDIGTLTLPRGSVIGETATTTVITPPGALPGQSLVIRPTAGQFSITTDHTDGFVLGESITVTVTAVNGADTGTLDYTFTGATAQQLGRATTGTLTYSSESVKSVSWTVPAQSDMTTFTFTITGGSGFVNQGGINPGNYITITLDSVGVEGGHVHLLSGNPATVDLYLGDDDQYVKIEKDGGDVVIGTATNANNWRFGTDGALTIPDAGIKGGPNGVNKIDLSWELILSSGKTIRMYPGAGGVVSPTFFGFNSDASGGGIGLPAGSEIIDSLTGVLISGAGETAVNRFYTKLSNTLYQTVDAGITYQLVNQAGTWSLDILGLDNPRYTSADLITWTGGTSPAPTGELTTRTTNLRVGTNTWRFAGDGKLTLPGALVKSTVAKDGPAPGAVGTRLAATVFADPGYNPLWQSLIEVSVAGFSCTIDFSNGVGNPGFTNIVDNAGNRQVGDILATVLGSVIAPGGNGLAQGVDGVDDLVVKVDTLSEIAVLTALDLTKTINKLADGAYTLANGVEGQIMYLVTQTGASILGTQVLVANGRILNSSGAASATVFTNTIYYPFQTQHGAATSNVATLIFTDGAWQTSNGEWA